MVPMFWTPQELVANIYWAAVGDPQMWTTLWSRYANAQLTSGVAGAIWDNHPRMGILKIRGWRTVYDQCYTNALDFTDRLSELCQGVVVRSWKVIAKPTPELIEEVEQACTNRLAYAAVQVRAALEKAFLADTEELKAFGEPHLGHLGNRPRGP